MILRPPRSQFLFTKFSRLAAVLASVPLLLCFAACSHRPRVAHAPAQTPSPESQPQTAPVPSQPGARPQPSPTPPSAISGEYVEEGVASWYGFPFQGRRTSNGEIYQMHDMTAAHRTLPFNAVVRVTNLDNGRQTTVRINDRGPFVANRVIDLSLAAAQAIAMVGPGTAHVRLEIVSGPDPRTGSFAVQVGAFLSSENAERLRANLAARYSPVSVVTFDSPNGVFYRVRVGKLPTEDAAHELATQLHDKDQFTTFVVRLD